MCEQIRKLDAHANHLLNGFLDLRAKYAMLEPMLFDKSLQTSMARERAHGFLLLRHTLFLSCAQDVAKLGCDDDKRTPSITKIIDALADDSLRAKLRDMYSERAPTVWMNENPASPELRAALVEMDAREEVERRAEYDGLYAELTDRWATLATTPAIKAFRVIRDKISAHTEIRLVDGKYGAHDIEELGIKWTDLRDTITEMQQIVESIGLLVRSCNFAWDMYDEQLGRIAGGYWQTREVA